MFFVSTAFSVLGRAGSGEGGGVSLQIYETLRREYLSKADLFRLAQHGVEKVPQLLGGELVTFQIGNYSSLPVQDERMESVRDETFVLPETHAELMTHFLDLEDWAS